MKEIRGRGSPKKEWVDVIRGGMRECEFNRKTVMNRNIWRAKIRVSNHNCSGKSEDE